MKLLFEDDDIIVLAKPAGQIVHPAPGHETGSLTEEIVRHFPGIADVGSKERPGMVHRLDMDTSGVMVFAKNQSAYLNLRRQFERHQDVKKVYLAVVHGSPKTRTGTIDSPVGRDHLSAVSHWRILGRHDGIALLEFRIDTGRMHQIRIHAKELGCPLLGDPLYGDRAADRRLRRRPTRTLLHAVELSFLHPRDGRRVTFAAEPPDDIIYAG